MFKRINCQMKPETRTRLRVENRLQYVSDILEVAHETPDLGNVRDPLDELLFLVIAQSTRISTALRIFRSLREAFPTSQELLDAPEHQLKRVVETGGRGNLRARAIRELLTAIHEREGRLSLARLRSLKEEEAFEYLINLPWVGEKTARCVMLYSLGINTFPADVNAIRILRRTRLLEPLIGSLDGVEHRKAQALIGGVIPPAIARPLHVNMVVHGQKTCRARNPRCSECLVRKFCGYWRNRQTKSEAKESTRMTVMDLFCGIGGFSLGFHNEGYRTLLAVDNDPATVQNYRLNHPWIEEDRVPCRDVRTLTKKMLETTIGDTPVDVLLAGVPCQGYSRVGYRTKPELAKDKEYKAERDPRNFLFKEVIRIARILTPRFILLENVPDIRMANVTHYGSDTNVIDLLNNRLGALGYHTASVLIDASEFRVPQKRTRLFFVASTEPLPEDITGELAKIANEMGTSDNRLSSAIGDLPAVDADAGTFVATNELEGNRRFIFNHTARYHNDDDLRIIHALRQGEKYAALVERKPEVLADRAHKTYSTKNFRDKYFRLSWDQPSRTIVAHLAKDGNGFIHPRQHRSLTVREAARIQSFPDDFILIESRRTQFTGIGNAVPPTLAQIFARFFKVQTLGA